MPSVEFQKTLGLIKEIFESYNTSVVSISSKKSDYDQVESSVLNILKFLIINLFDFRFSMWF